LRLSRLRLTRGGRLARAQGNGGRARKVAKELANKNAEVIAVEVDVGDEARVEAAFKRVVKQFGRLDRLVAGAGIFLPDRDARVDALDKEVWDAIIGVNLTGMFLTCKHGIGAIRKTAKTGAVVCISSPTGTYGLSPETSAYASSKGGIVGMVRTMAVGYAPDIRINVIMPGVVLSPIADPEQLKPFLKVIPLQRAARADEIASVIAFLASDESSFMTGSVVYSDGGVTAGAPPPRAD
jgi:NAD(P)-dependent dehydrogenase (short-subunit alcohol dehydrogenase family)